MQLAYISKIQSRCSVVVVLCFSSLKWSFAETWVPSFLEGFWTNFMNTFCAAAKCLLELHKRNILSLVKSEWKGLNKILHVYLDIGSLPTHPTIHRTSCAKCFSLDRPIVAMLPLITLALNYVSLIFTKLFSYTVYFTMYIQGSISNNMITIHNIKNFYVQGVRQMFHNNSSTCTCE